MTPSTSFYMGQPTPSRRRRGHHPHFSSVRGSRPIENLAEETDEQEFDMCIHREQLAFGLQMDGSSLEAL
jgi:hypothetical protein